MKRAFLFLLMLCGWCSYAQTVSVEGGQTGVWDADTVQVTGNVWVVDSLRILSGTTVLFEGFYKITVGDGAVLKAQGFEGDSVIFTVADTIGLGNYSSLKGAWNGIEASNAGSIHLDYCVLQYAKASDSLDYCGGVLNLMSCDDVEINHCHLQYNYAREHGGAINALNTTIRMSNCLVNNNKVFADDDIYYRYGGACRFLKCDVVMTNLAFMDNIGTGCIGGALSLDSCSVVLDRAVFEGNIGINGGGLYIMRCNDKYCRLSNALFNGNYSVHFGGGLAFSDASPEVYNVTVTGNDSDGVNCSGIFFYQYSSPKFYNCIVYGNYPITMTPLMDTVQMWMWTYDGCGPEFRNCLIERGTEHIQGEDFINAFEDIIDADPRFVDPEGHDFRLREDSPCRDVGWLNTPEDLLNGLDLAGSPRLSNGRVDLGPYEYSALAVKDHLADARRVTLEGNPLSSASRLVLQLDEDADLHVCIFALSGVKVASGDFGWHKAGQVVLELAGMTGSLTSGIYLIEVNVNGRRYAVKAVK